MPISVVDIHAHIQESIMSTTVYMCAIINQHVDFRILHSLLSDKTSTMLVDGGAAHCDSQVEGVYAQAWVGNAAA